MQPNENNNQNNNLADNEATPAPTSPAVDNDTMQPLQPPESSTSPFAPGQPAQNIDSNTSLESSFNATIKTEPAGPTTNQAPNIPAEQQPIGPTPNPNLTIVNNVPKAKKSPVAAIIIILLILLLTGGGAAAYFILGNKKQNPVQTNNEPDNTATTAASRKIFKNDELKLQFSYPETWGTATMETGKLLEQQKGKYNEISFSTNTDIKINLVLGPYGSALDACGYDDPVKNAQNSLIGKKASVIGWELKNINRYILDFNGQGSDVATTVKVDSNSSNLSERWTEVSTKDKVIEYKDTEQPETQIKATNSTDDCGPITQAQADEANSYTKFFHYAANQSSAIVKGVNAHFDARKSDNPTTRTQIIEALNSIQFTN